MYKMSELVENAIAMKSLTKKMKEYLKHENNVNELKQFIWNKLLHKYKDDTETYNYINSNISNSLNGLTSFNIPNEHNIEIFLFVIKHITNSELINDLYRFIDDSESYVITKLHTEVKNNAQQIDKIMKVLSLNNLSDNTEILHNIHIRLPLKTQKK